MLALGVLAGLPAQVAHAQVAPAQVAHAQMPTPEVRAFTPETGFAQPGRYAVALTTPDGRTREALVDVPAAALAGEPAALVFALHGATSSGRIMARRIGLNALAEREGFIVIYPDGLNGVWNDGRTGDPRISPVDDRAWLTRLGETVAAALPAPPAAWYAVGYSMGGMMGVYWACSAAPDVPIEGIALVASTMPAYLLDGCRAGDRPLSILFIVGTEDTVLPFEGTRGYLSAVDSAAFWGARGRCEQYGDPAYLPDADPADGVTPARIDITGCADDARVALIALFGGGHTWPGRPFSPMLDLGAVSLDFDAGEVAWQFLSASAGRASP
jgi:polyhydroxybutyrate depolymerase